MNFALINKLPSTYKTLLRNNLVAFGIWLLSMLLLYLGDTGGEIMVLWGIIIPFGILFYTWSFYSLIPTSYNKKRPLLAYIIRTIIILILTFVPLVALIGHYIADGEQVVSYTMFNCFLQLLVTAPVCWQLYKRYRKGAEEVTVLKKELGRSTANLDFLRSQINPHFLFNALNTIYGTAIQEKAERTSEGIEKLGDMMRFMLQENMQEKISLTREIDYLNNYIDLQRLRTDPNPGIQIETSIDQQANNVQIAPMLLIPFVENAFKHGISFREPSRIKVTLEIREQKLFFDVYNSRHPRQENDPEKDKSGIGLNNVKQRLQLLYRNKHELIIRETGKEFFVHLTIQLS